MKQNTTSKRQRVAYAKIRMQKRQVARNTAQLIDRVSQSKGTAISANHIRKDAFNAAKRIKALDTDGIELVKAGQYNYLPTPYEQGARLGRHYSRPTDKNTAVQSGFRRSVDEAIMYLCSLISTRHNNTALTARDVYRRRRKLAASYLVRERGWLLADATEYVHASQRDADVRIRDVLRAITESMPARTH